MEGVYHKKESLLHSQLWPKCLRQWCPETIYSVRFLLILSPICPPPLPNFSLFQETDLEETNTWSLDLFYLSFFFFFFASLIPVGFCQGVGRAAAGQREVGQETVATARASSPYSSFQVSVIHLSSCVVLTKPPYSPTHVPVILPHLCTCSLNLPDPQLKFDIYLLVRSWHTQSFTVVKYP